MASITHSFKIKTAFNEIEAVFESSLLQLKDRHNSLHSVIDLDHPERLVMENLQMMMVSLLFIRAPRRILLLGVAGGSLLHFIRHHYPDCEIDAVDIDAELMELMTENQWLPEACDKLHYHCMDAFEFMRANQEQYDLILVDLFIDTQTPGDMLLASNLQQIIAHLSSPGLVTCNLLFEDETAYFQLFDQWESLFGEQIMELGDEQWENQMLLGFNGPLETRSMNDYLEEAQRLSDEHGFDYTKTLSALFMNNPVIDGLM